MNLKEYIEEAKVTVWWLGVLTALPKVLVLYQEPRAVIWQLYMTPVSGYLMHSGLHEHYIYGPYRLREAQTHISETKQINKSFRTLL